MLEPSEFQKGTVETAFDRSHGDMFVVGTAVDPVIGGSAVEQVVTAAQGPGARCEQSVNHRGESNRGSQNAGCDNHPLTADASPE